MNEYIGVTKEIWRTIIEYVDINTEDDLFSFALTCRHFNSLVMDHPLRFFNRVPSKELVRRRKHKEMMKQRRARAEKVVDIWIEGNFHSDALCQMVDYDNRSICRLCLDEKNGLDDVIVKDLKAILSARKIRIKGCRAGCDLSFVLHKYHDIIVHEGRLSNDEMQKRLNDEFQKQLIWRRKHT